MLLSFGRIDGWRWVAPGNVPSQLSLEAANEGDGGDQALTTAVTGHVQEAGSRVLANPFWSDRATEEFHLQQARPNTLPPLGSLPEDARTVHDAGQTDAYGGPEAQGHDVRHDSNQEAPSRERSTSPGVKLILTEMKQLLQDIVATQQEHGSRLEKLESPELQSACSVQASSHGNPNYVATQPIVQETLNQNSNFGSRSQGAQGQFVFPEGVPLPVSAGARAAPDTNAGGCQHFYIGGPLKQKSQKTMWFFPNASFTRGWIVQRRMCTTSWSGIEHVHSARVRLGAFGRRGWSTGKGEEFTGGDGSPGIRRGRNPNSMRRNAARATATKYCRSKRSGQAVMSAPYEGSALGGT